MQRDAMAPEPKPIVYVIDDDAPVRAALDSLIRSVQLDVASFASADEFMKFERSDAPACIILDVRLPGQSGLDFQREMSKSGIALPIIFITGHGDIPMSVRAMKAGAIEFLTKPFREQELLDAINVAIERDRANRKTAAVVATLRDRFGTLTERERQVASRVVTGKPNKQIAGELHLSEVTVKVHRRNIMQKMKAKTFAELVRMIDRLDAHERH